MIQFDHVELIYNQLNIHETRWLFDLRGYFKKCVRSIVLYILHSARSGDIDGTPFVLLLSLYPSIFPIVAGQKKPFTPSIV